MFDIGWSELLVIAVVALVAIGPKELPGVLRMIGQWIGKARRMASEFQGQFNEAMREAEMADIKKSFDDVSAAARSLNPVSLLTSAAKDVEDAVRIEPSAPAASVEPMTESTFVEADATTLMTEIPEPMTETPVPAPSTPPETPDAKAS
ncbi:MAG: Sec-independent protein translocase protein TatB [Xanthobacteraceae bacterium]|nr:Sec-independent protein translocase protein TatB [Xanthobacteraceae bacterium]